MTKRIISLLLAVLMVMSLLSVSAFAADEAEAPEPAVEEETVVEAEEPTEEEPVGETPAAAPQNILVVGGGPAGMECALRAARRGHRVTLWERGDRLGGQVALFAPFPARVSFGDLLTWDKTALAEAGVTVVLNKNAAAEDILSGGFDKCVLANGRTYKPLPVPVAADAVPVYTAHQVLTEHPILPARVAVICGSFIGLELARAILMDGSMSPQDLFYRMRYGVEPDEKLHAMLRTSDRQVAVFEKGKLGAGYEPGIAWPVLGDLKSMGAELHPTTTVTAVTAQGVETAEGVWSCDAVVICPGTRPDDALAKALEGRIDLCFVGNADHPGRTIDAIEAGCQLGCTI